jgi:hypothetical protein
LAPGAASRSPAQRSRQLTSLSLGGFGAVTPPPLAPPLPADAMLPPARETPAVLNASATMKVRRPVPAADFGAKSLEPLFLGPTGLAVGLAPKERRYGPSVVRFAPGPPAPLVPPLPRGQATRDSAGSLERREYIDGSGGMHTRTKKIANNPHAGGNTTCRLPVPAETAAKPADAPGVCRPAGLDYHPDPAPGARTSVTRFFA